MSRHGPVRWIGRLAGVARRTAPRTATSLGRRLVATGGGSLTTGDIERRTAAARAAWEACDLVVAPSASLAAEFRALGFRRDTLVVSDYGFPPLPASAKAPAGDGRLRVGFIGTLVWHKGVDLLVDAVRLAGSDRLTLTVHGDTAVFPDYSADLRRRADGLPVTFAGRLRHEDLAAALAALDVLAVPSRWLENSPLVIHEAFQAGVAVIGADIGGISELLASGGGVLVAPDDAAALAAALKRLADSPALCAELARAVPDVKPIARDAVDWLSRYQQVRSRPPGVLAS
jgi:glycosyltransferase involved in cell wall biosynthesis